MPNFIEIALRHGCSHVNSLHILWVDASEFLRYCLPFQESLRSEFYPSCPVVTDYLQLDPLLTYLAVI